MDNNRDIMLFDFSVSKEAFNELSDHIIEHLLAYKLKDSGEKELPKRETAFYEASQGINGKPNVANSKPESKDNDILTEEIFGEDSDFLGEF